MNHGTLHAKRINHNMSEVFVKGNGKRTPAKTIGTTELLLAAARHSPAHSFDTFYAALAQVGSYASLTSEGIDAMAADLGLSYA
ncbi:hypothetical protein [Terriglobus roseus]|nr:hypothetical protein [Terriglobus roseus]